MSEPTFVPLNTGDKNDDDGQVIDSLLIETNTPPEPLPDASVDPQRAKVRPRKTGRLLTGTWFVPPGWHVNNGGSGPTLVLPADPDRKTFRIQVVSPTAGDYIVIADDAGKLQGVDMFGGARIYATTTGNQRDIDNHTGPLYIVPAAANNALGCYVSYWAVTE